MGPEVVVMCILSGGFWVLGMNLDTLNMHDSQYLPYTVGTIALHTTIMLVSNVYPKPCMSPYKPHVTLISPLKGL